MNSFGGPVIVKSSLTSGFFQKFASTYNSSLENDSKNTYKLKTYQIWARLLAYQPNADVTITIWALCVIMVSFELLICDQEIVLPFPLQGSTPRGWSKQIELKKRIKLCNFYVL